MASSSAAPEPQPQPQPQPAALFARPADRELLDHLRRWIGGGAATLPSWIREAEVYDHAPSELMVPAAATTAADGGLAWYFVTKLRHLGPHDQRIRRTAGGGTWKLEHDHPLASEPDSVHLDIKRSLSFGVRDAYGRYGRTGHLMREFLLADGAGLVPGGEVALCELYHTPRGDDLAVAKAVDKARQRMKMAEEKKIAKSRRLQVMVAAKAAKAREGTAAREAIRASKAQHRASLKVAAAAAIRAFKAAAPPAAPTTAPAAAPLTASPAASPAPPTTASAAAPLTASPAAPTTASAAPPLTASPAAPTTASAAAPLTASPAAPTTASAAALTPAPAVGPTDAVPAKGKKRGAAKEVDRAAAKAAAEAAFAAAVGRPRVPVPAWLTPDALSAFATSQQKKKSLVTASSATSSTHSPPKRLLLLQVGIEDNKVYGAQQLEDGPSFKKVKSIDCSGERVFTGLVLMPVLMQEIWSTYKRRREEGAVIGVAAAAAKARPVKERFIHSRGASTSSATSSFHEVVIPPHSGGRRCGCRWVAAQLLVVQVGARIMQVGGALPLATRAGRRWGPISEL